MAAKPVKVSLKKTGNATCTIAQVYNLKGNLLHYQDSLVLFSRFVTLSKIRNEAEIFVLFEYLFSSLWVWGMGSNVKLYKRVWRWNSISNSRCQSSCCIWRQWMRRRYKGRTILQHSSLPRYAKQTIIGICRTTSVICEYNILFSTWTSNILIPTSSLGEWILFLWGQWTIMLWQMRWNWNGLWFYLGTKKDVFVGLSLEAVCGVSTRWVL